MNILNIKTNPDDGGSPPGQTRAAPATQTRRRPKQIEANRPRRATQPQPQRGNRVIQLTGSEDRPNQTQSQGPPLARKQKPKQTPKKRQYPAITESETNVRTCKNKIQGLCNPREISRTCATPDFCFSSPLVVYKNKH